MVKFWEIQTYLYFNCSGRHMAIHVKIVHRRQKFSMLSPISTFHSLLLNFLNCIPPPLSKPTSVKVNVLHIDKSKTDISKPSFIKLSIFVSSSLYPFDIHTVSRTLHASGFSLNVFLYSILNHLCSFLISQVFISCCAPSRDLSFLFPLIQYHDFMTCEQKQLPTT